MNLTDHRELAAALMPSLVPPRQTRRLADRILMAAHQACDENEFDVARRLLEILAAMLTLAVNDQTDQKGGSRRAMDGLVLAHERLWHLNNPTSVFRDR